MKGFSLVETLVAIAVLITAVTGVLFAVSQSIFVSGVSRDQVIAFYLAQEAVEYIRNARDNNKIAGSAWLSGLSECMGGNRCVVDVAASPAVKQLDSCPTPSPESCPVLFIDSSGFYNQENRGEATIFRRSAVVTEIAADREAVIEVETRWSRGRLPDAIYTTRAHMLNWQE